jgi:hypothetical protein
MLTKITGMDADNNITMDLAEFVWQEQQTWTPNKN